MSARKPSNKINLLPQIEFNTTFWGRVLLWALSSFRAMVIIIEIVVMSAFMSRFWLDAKMNDLNDNIREKSAIITAWKDFEKEFKSTQKRLGIFSQVAVGADITSSNLSKITSYLPNEIILTSYAFSPTQIIIKGQSISEMAVAQLVTNLNNDKQSFSNITIESMGTNAENPANLDFSLKISLAKGDNK